MRIVAGLGNPGSRYRHTRHNAGFRVVDLLAARAGIPCPERASPHGVSDRLRELVARLLRRPQAGPAAAADPEAWLAEASLGGVPVLLVKPLAFMNRSGVPIARVLAARGASAGDLVVIVDDVALPLGAVRVRPAGRHGGHNGLRSVIEGVGTEDFARVRIGVRGGALPPELADYVLAEPPVEEATLLEAALCRAADAVQCLVSEGLAAAMDRFNARRA